MKNNSSLLLVFILLIGFSSCYDEPEFPNEPFIVGYDGDRGLVFKEVEETGKPDTLAIRVQIQDGNGDLGINDDSSPFFYPVDNQGNYIRFDPEKDEFDCRVFNFQTYIGTDSVFDTIQYQLNPDYYNFLVDIYVKGEEEYELYDFRANCQSPPSGRFPPLKKSFENNKPIEGVIQYNLPSFGLLPLFRNDSLKISVQIIDRAGNKSNVKVSDPFTLRGVQVDSEEEG